jgi:hypothetical protein
MWPVLCFTAQLASSRRSWAVGAALEPRRAPMRVPWPSKPRATHEAVVAGARSRRATHVRRSATSGSMGGCSSALSAETEVRVEPSVAPAATAGAPSEAAAAPRTPTRVIAKRLRKRDQEWEFMVEWSDKSASTWIQHNQLGPEGARLVTQFNMSKPQRAQFGMGALAYSCVQHIRMSSAKFTQRVRSEG